MFLEDRRKRNLMIGAIGIIVIGMIGYYLVENKKDREHLEENIFLVKNM